MSQPTGSSTVPVPLVTSGNSASPVDPVTTITHPTVVPLPNVSSVTVTDTLTYVNPKLVGIKKKNFTCVNLEIVF